MFAKPAIRPTYQSWWLLELMRGRKRKEGDDWKIMPQEEGAEASDAVAYFVASFRERLTKGFLAAEESINILFYIIHLPHGAFNTWILILLLLRSSLVTFLPEF